MLAQLCKSLGQILSLHTSQSSGVRPTLNATMDSSPPEYTLQDLRTGKKLDAPAAVLKKSVMNEIFLTHELHSDVYTNGLSCAPSSGVAVVILAGGITQRFRLGHMISSATAELAAIYEALKYISTQSVR